jgi:hypothetical protein
MSLELKVNRRKGEEGPPYRLDKQRCTLTLEDDGLFVSVDLLDEEGQEVDNTFIQLFTEEEIVQLKYLVDAALHQINRK